MSRVAKKPVVIPAGVEVNIDGQSLAVRGPKGATKFDVHKHVRVAQDGNALVLKSSGEADAGMMMAGTMRSLLSNAIAGVSQGFERKLELVGVGYRAQVRGQVLNLALGFSQSIDYVIPAGVTIETPSQTEIIIKGVDKQLVGHVAARIRAFRPPEPYKGKGVKYAGESIVRKEAKKK
jgi:large subunit ribosomal protein L6